jgi:hypothetical protein
LPQKIYCSNCGHKLYVGLELESPIETIHKNGGLCPGCKNKLDFNIEAIKITPMNPEP